MKTDENLREKRRNPRLVLQKDPEHTEESED